MDREAWLSGSGIDGNVLALAVRCSVAGIALVFLGKLMLATFEAYAAQELSGMEALKAVGQAVVSVLTLILISIY